MLKEKDLEKYKSSKDRLKKAKDAKKQGVLHLPEANKNALFPSRLRELRVIKGRNRHKRLPLHEVARDIGIAESTLNAYELGQNLPDVQTLVRIADYYDVPCDYLVGKINSTKSEHIDISKKTGLSEEAINTLIRINDKLNHFRRIKPPGDEDGISEHVKSYRFCQNVINALLSFDTIEPISTLIYMHLRDVKKELADLDSKEERASKFIDTKNEEENDEARKQELSIYRTELIENNRGLMTQNINFATWAVTERLRDFIVSVTLDSIEDKRLKGGKGNGEKR